METIEKETPEKDEIPKVGIKVTSGIAVILIGVKVSQEMDNFQVILEEMIEVVVGLGQVLGQVQIETELDVSHADIRIILVRIVQIWQQQKRTSENRCNRQWKQNTT